MDFILINPQASLNSIYLSKSIPLGVLFLAESLVKNGFSVKIIDDNNDKVTKIVTDNFTSDTIGFGISTFSGTQLKNAIAIARNLKNRYPDKPIFWGGAHINALPLQTLQSDLVDYIAWGEAEQSLPQLLNAIKNKQDITNILGIGYKNGCQKTVTNSIGYTDLNGVFDIPYSLLDMETYARPLNIGLKRCFSIFTSRGCPFMCKFCSNSSKLWPNTKMRYHTIEHIIEDIKKLVYEYHADGITFSDENVFINESRLVEICNALKKQNFKIKYRTSSRIDLLSKLSSTTWELLREAGFVSMAAGIESGSQRILDIIGKGITTEQIYKVDELLTRYGFFKTYNFMTCIPGETVDDLKETLKLIISIAKTSMYSPYPFGTLHKYIPLPNTELFDVAVKNGFVPPEKLEDWTCFDFENIDETRNKVRPWIDDNMWNFTNKVNGLIEELNYLYTGLDHNKSKINFKLKQIEDCI